MLKVVLFAALLALGVAQQSLGTKVTSVHDKMKQLTNQNNRVYTQLISGGDGSYRQTLISASEKYLVWSTDPDTTHVCPNTFLPTPTTACKSLLYSISTDAASAADRKILSQESGVPDNTPAGSQGGVNPGWRISPAEGYVVYAGQMIQAGNQSLYSVPINDGEIRVISPNNAVNSQAATPSYDWRPSTLPVFPSSSFSVTSDSQVLMLAKTKAGTCTSPCNQDANEIWTNNVYGQALKRVSGELGTEGNNKLVSPVQYGRDWIIYTSNNGTSTASPSTDPRVLYMTNWDNSQEYRLSPATTIARVGGLLNTPSLSCGSWWDAGCDTLWSPNYQYIAVREYIESNTYKTLRIFDMGARALMTGGAAINPALNPLGSGVTRVYWAWDSSKVFFTMTPASNPLQEHLYMWNPSKPADAAVKLTPEVADGSSVTNVHVLKNNWIVFKVTKLPSATAGVPGLYSYNFALNPLESAVLLNPTVLSDSGSNGINNIRILPNTNFDSNPTYAAASDPYVVFNVRTSLLHNNLFSVPAAVKSGATVKTTERLTKEPFAGQASTTSIEKVLTRCDTGVAYIIYRLQETATNNGLYAVAHNAVTSSSGTAASATSVKVSPDLQVTPVPSQPSIVTSIQDSGDATCGFLGFGGFYQQALNSSDPVVYVSGIVSGQTTPYYYVANCRTGQITQLTVAPALPIAAGQVFGISNSPDKRFIAYRVNAVSLLRSQLFVQQADGAAVPVQVNVTSSTQSFVSHQWVASTQLVGFRTDSDTTVGRTRMYAVQLSLPLSSAAQVDLTMEYANFPNGDPTPTSVGVHSVLPSLVYTARYPNAVSINNVTSQTAWFAVSPAGGDTVRFTWNGTVTPTVSLPQLTGAQRFFSTRASVAFFGDSCNGATTPCVNQVPQGGDVYINTDAASSLVPAFALLVVLLGALVL